MCHIKLTRRRLGQKEVCDIILFAESMMSAQRSHIWRCSTPRGMKIVFEGGCMSKRSRGFTLIEVLVVITVISIIAAILFPVFAKVREKARQTTCLNNLKQLGIAMQMYADDSDGCFPGAQVSDGGHGNPYGNWAGVYNVGGPCDPTKGQIYPYVKNAEVYLCPSDRGIAAPLIDDSYAQMFPLSYTMNYLLAHINMDCHSAPQDKVGLLLHEDRSTINGPGFASGSVVGINDEPSRIHSGGTCVIFCDSHARWYPYDVVVQAVRNGEWEPDEQ